MASSAIRAAAASSTATFSTRVDLRAGPACRQVGDQQAHRGGAAAEAADQPEPAVDDLAGRRIQRIGDLLGRAGQRLLGVGQPLQERPHVGQPLAHRGPGGLQDQGADGGRHLGQVSRQVQAVVAVQPLAQRGPVGGGRAASQDEVGEGAEGEHVEPDPVRVAVPHAFRRLERFGQPPVHVHRAGAQQHAGLASGWAGSVARRWYRPRRPSGR